MMGPPTGTRIYLVAGVSDMRNYGQSRVMCSRRLRLRRRVGTR